MDTHVPAPGIGRRPRLLAGAIAVLAGALAVTLLAAGPSDAAKRKRRAPLVKVMTRNLYLGSVLDDAAAAPDVDGICDEAGEIYNDVATTNFPKRARALAREIKTRKPDLVGLQEAALWLEQTPPDQGVILGGTPATTVTYDFLKILLRQINKGRGPKYRRVAVRRELDLEASANTDGIGSGCAGADRDIRLVMRDAILARNRAGVRTYARRGRTFKHLEEFTLAGGVPYPINRGWVSTMARVRGSRPFKFINTHLESFDDGTIRNAQAKELLRGPAAGRRRARSRIILVGDLNSDPTDAGATRLAFRSLIRGGFKDRTPRRFKTSGIQDELLMSGSFADFKRRIDHVLANKRSIRRVRAFVFGKRKVNGLYPSDHAGVMSVLRVR